MSTIALAYADAADRPDPVPVVLAGLFVVLGVFAVVAVVNGRLATNPETGSRNLYRAWRSMYWILQAGIVLYVSGVVLVCTGNPAIVAVVLLGYSAAIAVITMVHTPFGRPGDDGILARRPGYGYAFAIGEAVVVVSAMTTLFLPQGGFAAAMVFAWWMLAMVESAKLIDRKKYLAAFIGFVVGVVPFMLAAVIAGEDARLVALAALGIAAVQWLRERMYA
ncbi:hypothetical protein [Gordonia sp. (in: high G+C Gram-positive bacteria)]|uniref:hypothetical protein n=1 Tax=Gordonia sp. (in: high G+C Gram-positive bacteria) TaxID=84139 RepID=UPI0039E55892